MSIKKWYMFAVYSWGHSNYFGEINKPEKQAIAYAYSYVKKLPCRCTYYNESGIAYD
jgi:hypothetical protein